MEQITEKLAILALAAGEDLIDTAKRTEDSAIIKSVRIIRCDPLVKITFKFLSAQELDLCISCSEDLFVDCCSIKSAIVSDVTSMLVEYSFGDCVL